MTNGELSVDVARLTELLRQMRIKQGKSPEPRRIEPFVSVPLSLVLIGKLEPFVRIAVKYTAILAGGTLHRIDTSTFDEYREYAELLRCSHGLWCRHASAGFRWMLSLMDTIYNADDGEIQLAERVRTAHFIINCMRHDTDQDTWEYEGMKSYNSAIAINAAIERLKNDPVAYESEYAAALERYEQLEEDDEVE